MRQSATRQGSVEPGSEGSSHALIAGAATRGGAGRAVLDEALCAASRSCEEVSLHIVKGSGGKGGLAATQRQAASAPSKESAQVST